MSSFGQSFRQLFDMIFHSAHMGGKIGRYLSYLHLLSIRPDL
jgi:hypothetical protein